MKLLLLIGLLIADGRATHYSPHLMDQVVANRVEWGQLDLSQPHAGYVAVADCKYLNRLVVLDVPEYGVLGPLLVADCGAMTRNICGKSTLPWTCPGNSLNVSTLLTRRVAA